MPDDKESLKQDFQQRRAQGQRRLSLSHYTDSQGFADEGAFARGRQRANSARGHADDQRETARAAHVMAAYRGLAPTPSAPGMMGRTAWLASPGTPGVPGTRNGDYHAAENAARNELNDPTGDPRRARELLTNAIDLREEDDRPQDAGHQGAIQLLRARRASIDRAIHNSAGTMPNLPDPEAAYDDAAADHVVEFHDELQRQEAKYLAQQKALAAKVDASASASLADTGSGLESPKPKVRRRKKHPKKTLGSIGDRPVRSGQRHEYEAVPDSPRRERAGSDDSGPTRQSVCSRIRKSICTIM